MLTPRQKYEVCRVKSGIALIPFFDTLNIRTFLFSTRNGNAIIKWGDATELISTTPKKQDMTVSVINSLSKTYSTAFTGDVIIQLSHGKNDVYSLALIGQSSSSSAKTNKYNITDFGTWIKQFSNLYSLMIQVYDFGTVANRGIIKGNLMDVPDSVERVRIGDVNVVNPSSDVYVDFNGISPTSSIKHFHRELLNTNALKISGAISNFPASLQFFKVEAAAFGSIPTYTAGKVWASIFDTFETSFIFSPSVNDSIVTDINNSAVSATGGKLISLHGLRTASSDSAVSGLQGKTFTVTCPKISDTSLIMPLSANLNDSSTYLNHATMVGTTNYTGGALNISTGNYAYIPNKTSLDFGTGSLYFGCRVKFNSITGTKGIIGKTLSGGLAGRYGIYLTSSAINAYTEMTAGNVINATPATPYNDGNFHLIELVCNRTLGKQMLYIDGLLINTTTFTPSNNNLAINARFAIGAYNDASGNALLSASELSGAIKDVFVHKFLPVVDSGEPATGQKVVLLGDSTITSQSCRSETIASILFTPTEISNGWSATNLAVGGATINAQLSTWNAHANKAIYDIIIIQVGLNDMNTATATTLTNYQNLINQINATKKAGAKVYISCMLPCKQRFVDLGMTTGHDKWVALNNAIMDSTFTGVDKRNNAHVALLDDGNGNLAAAYDCGDHIHENSAGAEIIKNAFRAMIF